MLPEDFYQRVNQRMPRPLRYPPDADDQARRRWRRALREKLLELLGIAGWHPPPAPIVRSLGCEAADGFLRERVVIEDGVLCEIPAYLLRPDPMPDTVPLLLALHGHGGYFAGGAMTAGVTRGVHPIAIECADALNYGYGAALARSGFMVLCPDAFNFGERVFMADLWSQRDLCHEYYLGLTPFGLTPLGLTVWGHQRVLDYGLTLPGVNGKAGCVGLSYGGVSTLFFAAVEPRIQAAVASGALHSLADATARRGSGCAAQLVPGLLAWCDLPDVALSIAPRPVHYELMQRDGCFPFEASRKVYDTVRDGYAAMGCPANVSLQVADTDHRYDGTGVAGFFQRHLTDSGGRA